MKLLIYFLLFGYPVFLPSQQLSWQSVGPWGGPGPTIITTGQDGTLLLGNTYGGIFRSSGSGEEWEYIGLDTLEPTALLISGPDAYLAGSFGDGLFRTTDGGNSWVAANDGIPPLSWLAIALAAHPQGDILLGTNEGGFRSSDEGSSWEAMNLPTTDDNQSIIDEAVYSILAVDGSVILAGTQDGLFRSADNGESWELIALDGPPGIRVYGMALHSGDYIFAATSNNGVYRSSDGGATWQVYNHGALEDNTEILSIAVDENGKVYAGGEFLYFSNNAGEDWEITENGLPPSFGSDGVRSIAISGTNAFAAASGISLFRSDDYGMSWQTAGKGLRVTTITAIEEAGDGTLFAGVNDVGLYSSTDKGATWTHIPNTLPWLSVYEIETRGEYIFVNGNTRVQRSADQGNTWEGLFGLPLGVKGFEYNSEGILFAGAATGVYTSSDNGDSWQPLTDSSFPNVNDIVFNAAGHLYTSSVTGVYRYDANASSWMEAGNFFNIGGILAFNINEEGHLFVGLTDGIYRSDDEGESWELLGLEGIRISGIEFGAGGVVYAATQGEGVFQYSNGSWEAINDGLTADWIWSAFMLDSEGYLYAGTEAEGLFKARALVSGEQNSHSSGFSSITIHPNPVIEEAQVNFSIFQKSAVRMEMIGLDGRPIHSWPEETLPAGDYTYTLDMKGLPAGTYWVKLTNGRQTMIKTLVKLHY